MRDSYYVVYDYTNERVLCYEETGEFIVFDDLIDATEETLKGEIAINIVDLPKGLRREVLEQISAETNNMDILTKLYLLWMRY